MPTFIDYHPELPPLPPEAVEQMTARIRAGKPDEHGVRAIDVLIGQGDGYCVTEAPDAAAVVASHGALGIPLRKRDVKQVTRLA